MNTTKKIDYRFEALWRFAAALTTFNILGHTFLGFEQSWAQPIVALATAYGLDLIIEYFDARAQNRTPYFVGGLRNLISFLLPAHITGLAVAMLIYTNDQLAPTAFATAIAVGSKAFFRIPTAKGSQHFLNPSNFGITVILLIFPWVGIAPPYHFTENLVGIGDWILPGLIVISGSYLNSKFTRKIPLLVGWLGGFIIQALVRNIVFDTPLATALLPLTGLAFILFTFYMISDPGTTPFAPRMQFLFGLSVAAVYGLLMTLHIVFGLFFALTIVCILRGLSAYIPVLVNLLRTDWTIPQIPALARRSES